MVLFWPYTAHGHLHQQGTPALTPETFCDSGTCDLKELAIIVWQTMDSAASAAMTVIHYTAQETNLSNGGFCFQSCSIFHTVNAAQLNSYLLL